MNRCRMYAKFFMWNFAPREILLLKWMFAPCEFPIPISPNILWTENIEIPVFRCKIVCILGGVPASPNILWKENFEISVSSMYNAFTIRFYFQKRKKFSRFWTLPACVMWSPIYRLPYLSFELSLYFNEEEYSQPQPQMIWFFH